MTKKNNVTTAPAIPPPSNKRGAGILLHITSLPSCFGIGDLGPEANKFADFLFRSGQGYWQLLPLNPIEADQGFSPYSSVSSIAGNVALISPERLVEDGLLDVAEINSNQLPNNGKVNYADAIKIKASLLEKAYWQFNQKRPAALMQAYDQFCQREAWWIDDFACYSVLSNIYKQPWYRWPEKFKLRHKDAIVEIAAEHREALNKVKWQQFIFFRQWIALKDYCNQKKIRLFGDLPFYVSYEAVDVWSHPEIFCLDKDGDLRGVAGVPPDYFNADGQLWGMPVFCWDVLKKQRYGWWINRFKKNMEMFDLLRLDHFRAFADFWEVPPGEKTAKNGKWKPGPGADMFNVVLEELGTLPFVAEDLGDINESVHGLRRKFNLPGMKVLQFAFGDNVSQSDYIPHHYTSNFVVYTGTHDNNTTVGWYCKDIGSTERKNLSRYAGKRIHEKNIHTELIRLAYSSVANLVIVPLQDVLGLDETARMNRPASPRGNWEWRLKPGQITQEIEVLLKTWCEIYDRR